MKRLTNRLNDQQPEQISPSHSCAPSQSPTFWAWLRSLCRSLIQHATVHPDPKIWTTQDEQGYVWWNAYDPSTGKSIRWVSQDQVRAWVEKRYR